MPETESQHDNESENRPDELETVIQADRLQTVVEILRTADDECILTLGREGFAVRLVDPGNIYMIDLTLDPDAFESVGEGKFTIGLDLKKLDDILSKADPDHLVHLVLDVETRKFHIEFGNAELEVAGIDPDSIRDEPDLPDLDLPNAFECEARHTQRAIDICGLVSDHAYIEGDTDAECVRFRADGDIDDASVELADELEFGDVREDVASLYGITSQSSGVGSSTGFLSEATGVIPKDAVMNVQFGHEFPVIIDWSFTEGAGEVQQIIAPRIESGI